MTDEPRNNPPSRDFQQSGIGLDARRMCMGCNLSRSILFSEGVGVRWRCMDCLAARRARAQSQSNVKEEA